MLKTLKKKKREGCSLVLLPKEGAPSPPCGWWAYCVWWFVRGAEEEQEDDCEGPVVTGWLVYGGPDDCVRGGDGIPLTYIGWVDVTCGSWLGDLPS